MFLQKYFKKLSQNLSFINVKILISLVLQYH